METMQVVTFRLNQTNFGVDILKVREIMRLSAITELPIAATYMRGVIDVRGEVIPVVDTRVKLGMVGQEESEESRLLLVEVGEKTIALLVDEVSEVLSIAADKISPLSGLEMGLGNTVSIEGVANLEEGFLILINVESLLLNVG